MKILKIVVQYDGTNFCGWQTQAGKRTVQQTLEQALSKVLGEPIVLEASGRTDKGVHAKAQVCTFACSNALFAFERLAYPVNTVLPDDVSIISCTEVPSDFHARYDARQKTYRYHFFYAEHRQPLKEHFALRVFKQMDAQAMQQACKQLEGTHDFSAFRVTKSARPSNVRTVFACNLLTLGEQEFELEVCGNGFLHNMVRIMAGTVIDCGTGKLSPEDVPQILASKLRSRAGKTLPANGLTLISVGYDS